MLTLQYVLGSALIAMALALVLLVLFQSDKDSRMSGTITGMICDGGKVGCALKVSTGSAAAVLCALTAMDGGVLRVSDGICAETPEQCIQNMARIGKQGMDHTDGVILDIMSQK